MIDPTKPVPYSEAVLYAARALQDGKATDGQQKLFLEWLLFNACDIAGVSFTIGAEDGRRMSDFHQGRQFPARQIAFLMKPEALAALKATKPRARRVVKEAEAL